MRRKRVALAKLHMLPIDCVGVSRNIEASGEAEHAPLGMTRASATNTRREFLYGAAAIALGPLAGSSAGCASGQAIERPAASAPQPAAVGTSQRPVAVDMHNHVYPPGTEPHRAPPPGSPASASGPAPEPEPESGQALTITAELKRSGFTAVCASFVLDFAANQKPGDARENLLRWFSAVDAELDEGHLRRALNLKDLESARDRQQPTIIQSVEGSHFIEGDLARIDEVYGRGLRHLQLLHEKDDMVAPLGDTNTGVAHLGGLTTLGAEVVKRCNRLGILVDLAHASDTTVRAALQIATEPLIVSHTNLDTWTGSNPRMAEMMKPRLISKETAKVIADAGGVVGVWTHLTSSLAELVASIKAMVDAIGVDHVGIGSDTDLLSPRVGKGTNKAYPGLESGFFVALSDELRRQGFSAEDIAKIGGANYCRVFDFATRGHA